MGPLTKPELLDIHNAIHQGRNSVVIRDKEYYISQNVQNLCREVRIYNITFMEQNPHKTTKYAEMARMGHRITWGIRNSGKWIFIINEKVETT